VEALIVNLPTIDPTLKRTGLDAVRASLYAPKLRHEIKSTNIRARPLTGLAEGAIRGTFICQKFKVNALLNEEPRDLVAAG
jgi:hypothetical protein